LRLRPRGRGDSKGAHERASSHALQCSPRVSGIAGSFSAGDGR
jgi:hypothetical protein